MSVYRARIIIDMVSSFSRSREEMERLFNFWMPSDFVEMMDDDNPIANRWTVEEIEELSSEVGEALRAIGKAGHFDANGTFVSDDDVLGE
jgi:hypothetical protein